MHRRRHNTRPVAGSLRDAAAQADRWAKQIDRLKESLPAPAFADTATAALPRSTETVEPVGDAEAAVEPPDRIVPEASAGVVPRPQSPLAADSDLDPRIGSAIDWQALPPAPPAFVAAQSSPGNAVRAVERLSPADGAGETALGDSAGGPVSDTQGPAALLTQTNQQLELIRQTLEKILAKPGSVVLD